MFRVFRRGRDAFALLAEPVEKRRRGMGGVRVDVDGEVGVLPLGEEAGNDGGGGDLFLQGGVNLKSFDDADDAFAAVDECPDRV